MNQSARRNQPGPGSVVQLPKGGFEHPFHDLEEYLEDDDVCMRHDEGKERPRIVSGLDFPTLPQVLNITSPVRRTADVCPL